MSDGDLAEVKARLARYEASYRRSAQYWKVGYRSLITASALLSSAAAIVSKLSFIESPQIAADTSSILAACAAVLTTLLAALDFESNFRSNRRSRYEVAALLLEAEKSTAKTDELLSGMQGVFKARAEDLTINRK